MTMTWLRRAARWILPARRPPVVLGSCPGFLWETHRRRWVPVEKALSCRHDAYSEIGPVYRVTGLQP